MKKTVSILLSIVYCFTFYTISSFSFDVLNSKYEGTYYMLGTFYSFITVRAGGCDVHIVYDELENQYISASGGDGYINNNYFVTTYEAYNIVNNNGELVRTVDESTHISGTVQTTNDYIDIIIHGMTYEKSN